jgi:hypothetical protein
VDRSLADTRKRLLEMHSVLVAEAEKDEKPARRVPVTK